MNNYKRFIYIGLVVLALTTIVIVQGNVTLGDFRPRSVFLLLSFAMVGKFWNNSIMKSLLIFSSMVFLSRLIFDMFEFSIFFQEFMEYAIPMILGLVAMSLDDVKIYRVITVYTALYLLINIATSINGCLMFPGAIREMAAGVAFLDDGQMQMYRHLGICSFGFASMMMVVPVVCVGIYKCNLSRKIKYACIVILVLSMYLLYLAETTTPMLIAILMTGMAVFSKRLSVKRLVVALVLMLVLVPSIVTFLHSANIFYGTAFESRIDDLYMVINGEAVENTEEMNERSLRTKNTIEAFLQSPVFGSQTTNRANHNYWLDMMAKYGIVGIVFYFLFFYRMCKKCMSYMSENMKLTYLLCIISVAIIAILKNCKGIEYWLFLFFLVPSILIYISKLEDLKNRNNIYT